MERPLASQCLNRSQPNFRAPALVSVRVLEDLSYAIRLLRKSPGFGVLSAVILALGIAVNTAVFSAVNVLVTRPLPFPEAERLALLGEKSLQKGMTAGVSFPTYLDWKEQSQVFEEMGTVQERNFNLTGSEEAESVHAARAHRCLSCGCWG